jgi:hypothetical protein
MLHEDVPVLFFNLEVRGARRSRPRQGGKMAQFWWQKVPSQIREKLNKSLPYDRFTSLATVAFRRRHFRLNWDKLPGRRQIAIAVTPEFSKRFWGQTKRRKAGEIR